MSVEDRLTGFSAGIEYCSIAIELTLRCDHARHYEDLTERIAISQRQLTCILEVRCWNNKNMCWRLRVNVIESDDMLVTRDDIGWYLASNNLAEQAIHKGFLPESESSLYRGKRCDTSMSRAKDGLADRDAISARAFKA